MFRSTSDSSASQADHYCSAAGNDHQAAGVSEDIDGVRLRGRRDLNARTSEQQVFRIR